MIYLVNGKLSPISIKQFNLIYKNYKDGDVFYIAPDNKYLDLYEDFLKEYPYIKIYNGEKYDVKFDLSASDIVFNFDSYVNYPNSIKKKIKESIKHQEEMLKNSMSERRYLHSMSVAETAKRIAESHNLDGVKAYKAGLYHDLTKEKPFVYHHEILEKYDPDKLKYDLSIRHSFSCKYYLMYNFDEHDEIVLNAVYNHTLCSSKDPYDRILYIADKREPRRNINDDVLETSFKDIDEAYNKLLVYVKEYLNSIGEEWIES